MTRLLLFILCMSLIGYSNAQDDIKPLTFTEVVTIDNTPSDVLYSKAEVWIATKFKNPTKGLYLKDKETGQIVVGATTPFKYSKFIASEGISGAIDYIIKINVKDNRYRLEITECYHNANKSFGILTDSPTAPRQYKSDAQRVLKWEQSVWDELQATMKAEIKFISELLKSKMRETSAEW